MKRKNLGNYEHEEVSISALVEEGDDHIEVLAKLKLFCHQALNMVLTQTPKAEVKEETKDEPVKKKATKKTTKKNATPKKEVEVSEPVEKEDNKEEAEGQKFELKDVKQILAQVWKSKGEGIAKDILKDFGVARSNELSEDQYAAVVKEAEKCLK